MTRGSSPQLIGRGPDLERLRYAVLMAREAERHVTHIMDKLGVSRRTEAALLAIRAGMVVEANQDRYLAPPADTSRP